MSYDISAKRHAIRAGADARILLDEEDAARIDFLRRLDGADFSVTDWEAQFIGGFIAEPRPLSVRQRECVDEMRQRYEHRLGVAGPTPLPPATPGKCAHFVTEEGRIRRCNEPATDTGRNGMELCHAHKLRQKETIRAAVEGRRQTLRSHRTE